MSLYLLRYRETLCLFTKSLAKLQGKLKNQVVDMATVKSECRVSQAALSRQRPFLPTVLPGIKGHSKHLADGVTQGAFFPTDFSTQPLSSCLSLESSCCHVLGMLFSAVATERTLNVPAWVNCVGEALTPSQDVPGVGLTIGCVEGMWFVLSQTHQTGYNLNCLFTPIPATEGRCSTASQHLHSDQRCCHFLQWPSSSVQWH